MKYEGFSPREGLLEYLDVIWGQRGTDAVSFDLPEGEKDWVCIATISQDAVPFKRTMFVWPDNAASIVSQIFKKSAEGAEVYVYPATFKAAGKTTKDNFKKSHTLWVDFDGTAPQEWDVNAHGVPKPTLRVISSTDDRQHNYWKLDKAVTSVDELESRNRTLAYELDADIGGWDCVQLLRPPYTTNYGYAKPDRKGKQYDVRIEELTPVAYSLTDFGVNEELIAKSPTGLGSQVLSEVHMMALNNWTEKLLDDYDHVPQEDSKLRSDALVSMAHQACELGWTDESIYSLVVHMDQKIGKYKNRSDKERRYADIVVRVRMKHPVVDNNLELATDVYMSVEELLNYNVQFTWILENIISEKSLGLLVSSPGLGKTTLSLRLAIALAGGETQYLNHNIVPSDFTKIMYYSLEMGEVKVAKFLHDMNLSTDEIAKLDNLLIYPTGKDMLLDTPQGRQVFQDSIARHHPTLIIIDSINKILKGSISDDDKVRDLTRYLTALCQDYGVSILLLHHDRKRGELHIGRETTLDDVYGSRFLTSECDYVITLNRFGKTRNTLRLSYVKSRFAEEHESTIIKRIDNLNFEVVDDKKEEDEPARGSHSRGPSPEPPDGFSRDIFGES